MPKLLYALQLLSFSIFGGGVVVCFLNVGVPLYVLLFLLASFYAGYETNNVYDEAKKTKKL